MSLNVYQMLKHCTVVYNTVKHSYNLFHGGYVFTHFCLIVSRITQKKKKLENYYLLISIKL